MPGAKDKEKCGLGQNCWFNTLETSKFIVIILKFFYLFTNILERFSNFYVLFY